MTEATRIDPRIRARRIAVQRDEGRKRLRRLLLAAGAVATGAAAWGVSRTPLLDVDHIAVTGAGHTGTAAVLEATHIRRGDAMLDVPLGAAAHRVARLPWVRTVDVTRSWPGTVRIHVVERVPAAAVPVQTADPKAPRWLVVDGEGRELAVVAAVPAGLLRLDVPPVEPALGDELGGDTTAVLDLAASIPSSLRSRVVALHPADGGTVDGTVQLRNGQTATVLLGAPTQTTAKWLALLAVLDDTDPKQLATIDLRVPGAPALTRR